MATSPKIRMTDEELSTFLGEERVIRIATIDESGFPAVVPLWYVWLEPNIWLWNLDRAERTKRLEAGKTPLSLCVDGGVEYAELRGMTARANYEFVDFDDVPVEVRTKMGRKYFNFDGPLGDVDDHTWMRLELTEIQTWDFRKTHGG